MKNNKHKKENILELHFHKAYKCKHTKNKWTIQVNPPVVLHVQDTHYIYIDIPSSYIQNMKQAHLQTKTMKMGG